MSLVIEVQRVVRFVSARQIGHAIFVEVEDRDVVAIGRGLRFPHGFFGELAFGVLEHNPAAWVGRTRHNVKITVLIDIHEPCVPIAAAVPAAADPNRFVRKLWWVMVRPSGGRDHSECHAGDQFVHDVLRRRGSQVGPVPTGQLQLFRLGWTVGTGPTITSSAVFVLAGDVLRR